MTIAGLAALAGLAWAYLLTGAGMTSMPGMAASPSFAAVLVMWGVMMVAMMVPAAAPTILLYARVHRHANGPRSAPPTALFLAGYLACWIGFAAIAAGLQTSFISSMSMALGNPYATGGLLIAAGIYQLTPFKGRCLIRCRSPALFLSRHYRPGRAGAFRLGLLHGFYCLGCCWLLMSLLFVGGVMNLAWVIGLTVLVSAEKLLPGGPLLARAAGVALISWGALLIFR